ncbi:hypothetical protein A3E39_01585 [Candidatus Uhrbacteria bacterium RIFCSPHIGHO2_12_FULL_60_25]|uniref:Uncharacterized protein n=1 Tax=Candidatus Uhrbacteria bacterium RIFCSPHIGHO2_12_FULL_60_25 TaxID=1802399 RepID=A0A1F7ULL7_9BACT|nr:MAG: hypothetical protein A3E39_01585 [Candidatus Uhrbacteria bacterium RIFCSPHIGHO2_12_FULL_60_25]
MRQERSIMSSHMGGPRGSAEVTRARDAHRAREKQREREQKLEHLPGHDALIHYLQRLGRGEDCTDELHCNPERYEPALMEDLYASRRAEDEAALREVREVIWAGSWRLHKTHDPLLAARLAEALKSGVEHERSNVERTNPEDAHDMDETVAELDAVARSLRNLETGEGVEPALKTIEDWFAVTLARTQINRALPRIREKAENELKTLRLIRDELLYARLFPQWAATRNHALREGRGS